MQSSSSWCSLCPTKTPHASLSFSFTPLLFIYLPPMPFTKHTQTIVAMNHDILSIDVHMNGKATSHVRYFGRKKITLVIHLQGRQSSHNIILVAENQRDSTTAVKTAKSKGNKQQMNSAPNNYTYHIPQQGKTTRKNHLLYSSLSFHY
ncbi:hypothetical protein L1887_03690 [Cichorium endivia]|nr:hypothetical protein L1887_03690 [Cichorium endivia]